MDTGGEFLGVEHSGFDILANEIIARVGRYVAVEGQISGLCADQDSFALQFVRIDQTGECFSDISFGTLVAIVDCGVEDIDSRAQSGNGCFDILAVCLVVRLTEISSETD